MLAGQLLIMLSAGSLLRNRLALGRQWLPLSGSKREEIIFAGCDRLLSSKLLNEVFVYVLHEHTNKQAI